MDVAGNHSNEVFPGRFDGATGHECVLCGFDRIGRWRSHFLLYRILHRGWVKKPVLDIVQNSSTGAATNIIAGLSIGMISTFGPILLFAGAIWGAYALAGFYGVAIAASAMMATTAMQLAIDAFGPIADNAGGIAEMSELPEEVRSRTDILDSVGNTTAAIGKGFAIASAALTALALFAAYVTFTGIAGINIYKSRCIGSTIYRWYGSGCFFCPCHAFCRKSCHGNGERSTSSVQGNSPGLWKGLQLLNTANVLISQPAPHSEK